MQNGQSLTVPCNRGTKVTSHGRLPRDCGQGCPFVESCAEEGHSRCPLKVRPSLFTNLFPSLLMHAVVLFFLLTVPIYSGSIHPGPYGYLRVSLKGAESGKTSGVLRTAQKVTSGRAARVGNPVERKPAGSPASTKVSVPGHNEVKQARSDAVRREEERQRRAVNSEREARTAKDVSGSTGRPVTNEEESGRKNEAATGGRESYPVITAKAGNEDEIKAMVRDLFEVPESVSAGRKAAPDLPGREETPAEKGSPEKAAASSGTIPPASAAPAVAPPEKATAMADEKTGGAGEKATPAVPGDAPIPENIGTSPDGIVPEAAPDTGALKENEPLLQASVPVLPEYPVAAASSLPVPAKDIGKDEHKARKPEPDAVPKTVSVEQEIRSAVTRIGETTYDSTPETSAVDKEKNKPRSIPPLVAQAVGKDEHKASKPEPAVPKTVSVEQEIRSAVTRIGETTYDSAPETSAVDKEKNRPQSIPPLAAQAVGKDEHKASNPGPEPAVPETVSVEQEIRSAVTRIGETTYDSGQEIADEGAKKNGPKVSSVKSGSESPAPPQLVLNVPAPSQPAIKLNPAGELLGGGPAGGSGNARPLINTDEHISGQDVLSENGAGGEEQVGAMTPATVKTGHEKTVMGFPLPDAFFLKDIKIQVSLRGTEMPEVSRRLLERPLTDGTWSETADNHDVAVKEETEDIAIGGRVSTEKMFSVAKAGKGIYTFVMENKGEKPYEADMAFVLYGGEKGERIKTYKDLMLLPGAALRFRFVLPQAVFWDDEDRFTGSIEDSNYITKFNYNSGLVWKEKKDY